MKNIAREITPEDTVPEMLSESKPSILIANDCFLDTDDELHQTFDRLEL